MACLRQRVERAGIEKEKVMKFAVHQPNFLPWVGYFAKIALVDEFVILDDVQFPIGRSYVYRSKIAGGENGTWLSVSTQKATGANIDEIKLSEPMDAWKAKHLNLIKDRYKKSAHFDHFYPEIEGIYSEGVTHLGEFNMRFIAALARRLAPDTKISRSSALKIQSTSDARIAEIGAHLGAAVYVSGSGGENYQSRETYAGFGIGLELTDYDNSAGGLTNVGYSVLDNLMVDGEESVREFIAAAKSK